MTENVINFKQAKKRAGYARKQERSAENRKKFGRSKSEKNLDAFEQAKEKKRMDDRKLSDD